MNYWIDRVRQVYEQALWQTWHDRYQAYRQGNEGDRASVCDRLIQQQIDGSSGGGQLPRSICDSYEFYNEQVMQRDWGAVFLCKLPVDGRDTYAVRVTTDGDDGWLELFDAEGNPLGVARTYIELVAWGDQQEIRQQVHTGGFPAALSDRTSQTLWQVES